MPKKVTSRRMPPSQSNRAVPIDGDGASASSISLTDPWHAFAKSASDKAIRERVRHELAAVKTTHQDTLRDFCCVGVMDSEGSIDSYEADKIYNALRTLNAGRDKNVLLIILSAGGSIEPAYQISKLCKAAARDKFVVAIPRRAKSAATLLALGADEIHMGPLGELGPIDPQLRGLPALGVVQALKTIAMMSEKFPGSAEMFSKYLRTALTVEQIGYCERIAESAVQYAERLLSGKPHLSERASQIAHELVYEYKHHGFVIDLDEARTHLGESWIISDSGVLSFAEEVYGIFEEANLFVTVLKKKRITLIGDLFLDVGILRHLEED